MQDELISRQAAIDALKQAYWNKDMQNAKDDPCIVDAMTDWAIRTIKDLPPVNPQHTDVEIQKMQELEQAEIQKAYELGKTEGQKTGKWIKDDITERSKSEYKYKCDRCGAYHRAMYDYCPSCGAKMVEPQESEGV